MNTVYVDTCVLISAAREQHAFGSVAVAELKRPDCAFLAAPFVELEALPKALRDPARRDEANYVKWWYREVAEKVQATETLFETAIQVLTKFNINTIDALHVAAAMLGSADELITIEGSKRKSILRAMPWMKIRSILPPVSPVPIIGPAETEEQIKTRKAAESWEHVKRTAHKKWAARGSPLGDDCTDWFEAEKELRAAGWVD